MKVHPHTSVHLSSLHISPMKHSACINLKATTFYKDKPIDFTIEHYSFYPDENAIKHAC